MHTRVLTIAAIVCSLSGCAKSLPKITLAPVDPSSVAVRSDRPMGAVMMGRVTGISCGVGLFGEGTSRAAALEQLKKNAAEMGASGVSSLRYANVGITMSPACSKSIKATAIAYHVDKS